jgi:glucokinase
MALSLGVDVGGTKILAGVVDEQGRVLRTERRPTQRSDVAALVNSIGDCVRSLDPAGECRSLGVSIAALLDFPRDRILLAPNGGWAEEPLDFLLERESRLMTVLENDGNAAAWGEVRFGAGRTVNDIVMITVGTGVGGGVVLNGQLRTGAHGVAGEVGHITMVANGLPCGCGRTGCWEQYASGSALVREARALATERRSDASLLLQLGNGTPEGVQGVHVTEAAHAGDAVALAAFARVADWLGRGMADLAAVIDPEMFIIGGGVSDAGDVLLVPLRASFRSQLMGSGRLPSAEVKLAELGNQAGLIGAADLARQRLGQTR